MELQRDHFRDGLFFVCPNSSCGAIVLPPQRPGDTFTFVDPSTRIGASASCPLCLALAVQTMTPSAHVCARSTPEESVSLLSSVPEDTLERRC